MSVIRRGQTGIHVMSECTKIRIGTQEEHAVLQPKFESSEISYNTYCD
jgi:hypothetical protein